MLDAAWRRSCVASPAPRARSGTPASRRCPVALPGPSTDSRVSRPKRWARAPCTGPHEEEPMPLTTVLSERIRPEALRRYEGLVQRVAKKAVQQKEAWHWTAHQTAFGEVDTIHYVSVSADFAAIGSRGVPGDPARLVAFQTLVGDLARYWTVRPVENLGELDRQLQPAELLNKAFGAAEGGLIFRTGLESIQEVRRQIVLYRQDLSNPS